MGRPKIDPKKKKKVVAFSIDPELHDQFVEVVKEREGSFKKSQVLARLIKRYISQKK